MRLIISLLLVSLFFSCGQNKEPDVSRVNVELSTYRFEKELFSLDTNNLGPKLDQLLNKYSSFSKDYISKIMGIDPGLPIDTIAIYMRDFIAVYRYVYDSTEKMFPDFSPYEKEIRKGLQFLHYYFPGYKLPNKIITYIGPIEGTASAISNDAILVGLQAHLGRNFSLYQQSWVQTVYAGYITDRFEPAYISVNCMKNIILDMYPERNEDQSLVIQMVEKGKRLYMLNKLLPFVPDHRIMGYTEQQMKSSYAREAVIWELFVQNNLLQVLDNSIIKNYIGEAPKTQELGEGSPGNIGSFAGWQIVKKYMEKNPGTTLPELMNTSAETIFQKAKYKP